MDGSRVDSDHAAMPAEAAAPSEHGGGDDVAALRQEVEALRRDLASARASLVASDSRVAAAETRAAAAEAGKTEASRELAQCKAHTQQVQQQLEATAAAVEELRANAAAEGAARAAAAADEAARGKREEDEPAALSRGPHFRDSTILARVAAGSVAGTAVDGVQALLGWLPGPHYTPEGEEWTLIYRGSRDGWHPSDFHAACDGRGPTLVLVLGAAKDDGREFVAGGYAAASWTSRAAHDVADPELAQAVECGSFLFSLVDAAGHGPVQLRLKDPADSSTQRHHGSHGPQFGYRALAVGTGMGSNTGKPLDVVGNSETYTSAAYSSYDATEAAAQGCTTFRGADHPDADHGYTFTTKELEVFALQ